MMRLLSVACLALGIAALVSGCGDKPKPKGDQHSEVSPTGGKLETDPIPYRAKGSKPSIDKPEFRNAADVPFPDGLNVIGVVVNGEAKAYPTFILNQHQVVNDWVGGVPVAPSW